VCHLIWSLLVLGLSINNKVGVLIPLIFLPLIFLCLLIKRYWSVIVQPRDGVWQDATGRACSWEGSPGWALGGIVIHRANGPINPLLCIIVGWLSGILMPLVYDMAFVGL
jgi:hypothetical protein